MKTKTGTDVETIETEEIKDGVTPAPKKEPLQAGQVSIIADGKEVIFAEGVMELPGMPDASRLRRLASAYVRKNLDVAEQQDMLLQVKQEIMMELRNEGRTGFAYRSSGATYIFEINKPEEALEIKRKK